MLRILTTGGAVMAVVKDGDEFFVGRADENDLSIYSAGVSRRHARLWREAGVWRVEDLGSKNGTAVTGHVCPPRRPVALADGDVVVLGGYPVLVSIPREGAHEG